MLSKVWMAVLGAALLAGCGPGEPRQETESEKTTRWQAEAETAMKAACSNDLVGVTRIVEVSLRSAEPHPNQWKGEVIAEHLNTTGGVERTNLPYFFRTSSADDKNQTHVVAVFDGEKALQGRLQAVRQAAH